MTKSSQRLPKVSAAPTIKNEAWRYADPKALEAYAPVAVPAPERVEGEQRVIEIMEPGAIAKAFDIQADAHLLHVRIFPSSLSGPAFANCEVTVGANASYKSVVVNFSPSYIRNEMHVTLNGSGSHADLLGTYMIGGKGHSDTLSKVHHAVADTTSDEVYKGVLQDQARGVFQAQICVAQDAQRIVGNQMHRALMLSDDARVDTKPELEIFADDVQCSHGATVGDLDETQMFYLTSRGVPRAQARALLIQAFIGPIVDEVPESHRASIDAEVESFLTSL